MFDTLDQQVERTEGGRSEAREHFARFASLVAISIVAFAALFALVVAFE
jgi:hypothetical protein